LREKEKGGGGGKWKIPPNLHPYKLVIQKKGGSKKPKNPRGRIPPEKEKGGKKEKRADY